MTTPVGLSAALRQWVADEVGDPAASITDLRRTSSGFSRENWVFTATWSVDGQPTDHALIARRDPPGSVLETDRRVETAVLRALEPTTLPTPGLRWVDLSGDRLRRPALVMDLVAGRCDSFALTHAAPADQLGLAHRLYDAMTGIHRLDWRSLGLGDELEDPGPKAALAALDHWEHELRRVQLEPEPELELVMAWLRHHAPSNPVTTLVHGDFKAGNVLLVDGEVSAILDWETVHLGDPREDLGWVTNPVRAPEHRLAGVWEPADLLARWSAQTGLAAEPDVVRWWQVLANLKLSVIVLTGALALVEGRLDRIHQAPVGLYRMMLDLIGA